jgi:hypothetical protein
MRFGGFHVIKIEDRGLSNLVFMLEMDLAILAKSTKLYERD